MGTFVVRFLAVLWMCSLAAFGTVAIGGWVSLFLLLKVALVLFFALDIELNERRILYSVLSDASFSLGDIDVVDEVESWRQRWNGRASSQEIAY